MRNAYLVLLGLPGCNRSATHKHNYISCSHYPWLVRQIYLLLGYSCFPSKCFARISFLLLFFLRCDAFLERIWCRFTGIFRLQDGKRKSTQTRRYHATPSTHTHSTQHLSSTRARNTHTQHAHSTHTARTERIRNT